MYDEMNLFKFIFNTLKEICNYLNIDTKIVISSKVNIDHSLKSQDKVIEICKALKSTTYTNAIGGVELYSKSTFKSNNLDLNFIKSGNITYDQFNGVFVPWLSIIDLMMFNSKEQLKEHLNNYTLM